MRLSFSVLCLCCLIGILYGKNSECLFSASFDGYSMHADEACGQKSCISFANPSLQLRMWEGVGGKGNALTLARSEECVYRMPGNFDPRQGTVSFWVSPLNWKPSERCFQWFFTASQPGFLMHVYKYLWPNYLFFYIKFDKAPGSQQVFVASARISDAAWGKNTWHRIDAVWNRMGMKLYVDGLLPTAEAKPNMAPTHPEISFAQPLDFPLAHKAGIIKLNHMITDKSHSDHRTAYDDLKIFNRPLSGKEIREAYGNIIPSTFGAHRLRQRMTVPYGCALEPCVPDGVSPRWSDASVSYLNQQALFSKNQSLPFEGKVYLKHDGKIMLIRLEGNQPVAKSTHTERDGAIWEDDSYEVHLMGGDGKTKYQFIVNSKGGLYDQRNGDSQWNGEVKVSTGTTSSGWGVELAIPLSDLGGKPLSGNFCYTNFADDMAAFGWNRPGSYQYAAAKEWGELVWDNGAVCLESLGHLSEGQLNLRARGSEHLHLKAVCESENGASYEFTGDLKASAWRMVLPSGRQRLLVTGAAAGKQLYSYEHFFYVHAPLELLLDCHAAARKLVVTLDFANADSAKRGRLLSGGLMGTLALVESKTGKEALRQSFKATTLSHDVTLDLTGIGSGDYRVSASVDGCNASKSFVIPDMRPYESKAGLNHSVPPPWTPVRELGARVFEVLDRSYAFGKGPFPRQLVSRGKPLFTQAPRLTLDGKDIRWEEARISERHPDVVTLAGSGVAGKFVLDWHGDLWFDGCYILDLRLRGSGNIEHLQLDYALPREFARYVFRQAYNKQLFQWKNDRIDKIFNPLKHPDHTLQWMSGEVQGLAFAPKSNANWANRDGEPNIILTRTDKEVRLQAKIISRKVKVSKDLTYTMVFQGTPSRRPDANWRDVNYGGYRVPTMQNLQFGGGGDHTFADYQTDQRWLTPSTHRPRWPERYKKQQFRAPKPTKSPLPYTLINYVMPMHLGTNEPEFDYFFNDWVTQPNCVWGYREDGIPQTIYSCCGQTGITDLALFHLERLLQLHPYVGIYNDCAHSYACENPRHGCGGVDALGQKFSTSTMLGQREYFLREFRLIRKYGRKLANHVPSADFIPFVHDFSDLVWPGEEFHTPFTKNPDYFYCEDVSREVYQSAFNPTIRGVNVCLLPQPARAANVPSLRHRKKAFETEPEWAIRTMTPVLLHGFNISAACIEYKTVDRWWIIKDQIRLRDAVFKGYWQQNRVSSSSPDVYVSYYELPKSSPYRYLLVAGNLGRKAQPLGMTVQLPFEEAVDLWNGGKTLTKSQLHSMSLGGNHFALIGIR